MNATMEVLEQAPEGTTIQVLGCPWERVSGGLKRGGITLGLEHFTGYVANGEVVVPPAPRWETGRWYNSDVALGPTQYRLVTGEHEGEVHVVDFTINRPDVEMSTFGADTSLAEWRLTLPSRVRTWQHRVQNLYGVLTEAPTNAIPEPFVRSLHDYAQRAGDAEFDGILDEYDIGRAREHPTSVTITGRNRWVPDNAEASHVLGDDVQVTAVSGSVSIYWRRVVSVTLSGTGCTCDQVNRDLLSQYVPDGVRAWDFEVSCGDAAEPF